jgi:hypothetical protein
VLCNYDYDYMIYTKLLLLIHKFIGKGIRFWEKTIFGLDGDQLYLGMKVKIYCIYFFTFFQASRSSKRRLWSVLESKSEWLSTQCFR